MTDSTNSLEAWLESAEGEVWPLETGCSIGRSSSNDIVLGDERVSRKHAIVHRQDRNEYWLVDLGSGNGSFVNGLRVALPTRLKDGDGVAIGATTLKFRQSKTSAHSMPIASSPLTVIEVKSTTCWMLVADLVGSTELALKHAPERWASTVGGWTGDCRRIVETNDGAINKYLGDGFLAIWPREEQQTTPVASAVKALLEMQASNHLPFRIAIHYGDVMMGGGQSMGEDSLSGIELVLLFRMEKIAGAMNRAFLASEQAASRLQDHLDLQFAGERPVTGFGEPRRFFGLRAR
ncbi:MAG: adenylate/guanylate cyclase domain-containing protein [Rhizobiales bacterium]|nr:adenylate/guanylate cyclase domain-containing protein [Hyphomicrobiales bacterium]